MLYTGIIDFKEVLPARMFKHFKAFSIAMNILLSPELAGLTVHVQGLLTWFVQEGIVLFGKRWATHNVHACLHHSEITSHLAY